MSEDCIFCKIIAKEMPTNFLYEDDKIVAFNDINPKASIHILVVPKKHINSLKEVTNSDKDLIFHTMSKIPEIAKDHNLKGFRTILNTGREVGQIIDHIHFHILGGNKLPGF